jgi:hypothetical protein
LGLVWAWRGDAWQRTTATVVLLYLAIVLGSGFKNLHWLAPLWPVTAVLYLTGQRDHRAAERRDHRSRLYAACSIAACIALCWPAQRQTFTLNRELGERTTIATDDELNAAQWARLIVDLKSLGKMSWECDPWTWVAYAELDPSSASARPLLLTAGDAPPGYRLLASKALAATAVVAKLYARDDATEQWLESQHPLEPQDRYPRVFRPLASGQFSPHDNGLPDTRHLR